LRDHSCNPRFFRFQYGEYQHKEIEGHEVGTRFDRKGFESRLELRHQRNPAFSGISGIQTGVMDIQARGEEALTPDTELFDFALFALESWKGDSTSIHYGIRAEHRNMDARGQRNYQAWSTSYSAGWNQKLSDSQSLNLVLSRSARHPTHIERYAHGPHAATRQFEIGDEHLGKEQSWGLDLSYEWTIETASMSLTMFANRFEDYLYAAPTDETHDGFQVFRYRGADADMLGFELEGTWQVWRSESASLQFRGVADAVRANIRGSEEHLPRIPAARLGFGIDYQQGGFALHAMIRRVLKQEDHAPYELPSDAYTTLDVHVHYTWNWGSARVSAFIKGNNLLDAEIRPHTSYLKDLAPMPGRGAVLGFTVQL
jgi:iron complex outermembrane recepter protein